MKPLSTLFLTSMLAAGTMAAAAEASSQLTQNLQHVTERPIKMEHTTQTETDVKKAIDDLIQTATTYDVAVLDRIYHDDLQVIMVDHEGNLNLADKAAFTNLFQSKKEAGDPPMNTWAEYHHIDVKDGQAHVLLSRKNDLSGQNMHLTLSIDLIFEDNRWQVTREVITLRPELS